MKYFLVFPDTHSERVIIIRSPSTELLKVRLNQAGWTTAIIGSEVKIWNHVPTKEELSK